MPQNPTKPNHIHLQYIYIYKYKEVFTLNNLQ